MSLYRFRMREDLPKGFRENAKYPELPAAVKFLRHYESDDIEFGSPEALQGILDFSSVS